MLARLRERNLHADAEFKPSRSSADEADVPSIVNRELYGRPVRTHVVGYMGPVEFRLAGLTLWEKRPRRCCQSSASAAHGVSFITPVQTRNAFGMVRLGLGAAGH